MTAKMSTENFVWVAQQRNYNKELKTKRLPRCLTQNHPLKAITVVVGDSKSSKKQNAGTSPSTQELPGRVSDVLGASMEGSDPLSMMAAELETPVVRTMQGAAFVANPFNRSSDTSEEDFESWTNKRTAILTKYTTSQKLSISFADSSSAGKGAASTGVVTEKVRTRLEQLDDFEEGSFKEMLNLNQQEYTNKIDDLNTALIMAWNHDQRVKALKIAIQCSKLLSDTSVLPFYPSKYVLITDILDTFGRLVYERIKSKASYNSRGVPVTLPDNFSPDMVSESAKETCRNWFYKIASIRELIPRFYVEVAILKSYSFLTTSEYSDALKRLAQMTRGIGDPLVSIYARCYLCKVGIDVAASIRNHLTMCFDDFLTTYPQTYSHRMQALMTAQKLDLAGYLTLYVPALDWILQCLAHKASEQVLTDVMAKSHTHCNSALLMNAIITAFKPAYVSNRAEEFIEIIKECRENGLPKYLLYRSLGKCLVVAPPSEDQRLACLNSVWKVVMKLKKPAEYIACAEVWIEYVAMNFTGREVNAMLGDILKHMMPDRVYEDFYPQLHAILTKVVTHMDNFSVIFSLNKFLPFLDMFQKESVKVEVCKDILTFYIKHQLEPTCDPVIVAALMSICKMMHDSVNALTLEDDVRLISNLINSFISTISYEKDFEKQLNFYVECRASFSNTDTVLTYLVHCVNRLVIDTQRIMNGRHTKKTAAFIRACVAYAYITIPSLSDVFVRLKLYLISGQVAIINNCLSQGDAFFKTIISVINDVPATVIRDGKKKSADPQLIEFILNFTSALLVIPDSPDQGALYLVKGLLNTINNRHWDSQHPDAKVLLFTDMLALLCSLSQQQLLYHAQNVESNDKLYGGDKKFIHEVSSMCNTLCQQILSHLNMLNTSECTRRQARLSMDLFNQLIAHVDLDNDDMLELAASIWSLAQRNGQIDSKHMVRCYSYVGLKASKQAEQGGFKLLIDRMSLQSQA